MEFEISYVIYTISYTHLLFIMGLSFSEVLKVFFIEITSKRQVGIDDEGNPLSPRE